MAEWLDDTEQIAWRGLVAFTTVGLPRIERTLKAHGLVHVEYGILAVLSEQTCGMRLSTLAKLLGVSPSRLTHRMAKLTERGLVATTPCPEDGRGILASITPTGRALVEAVAPVHVEDVRATVFDHLDAEETRALAAAMSQVAAGLGAGLADAVARRPGNADAAAAVG
jgi:DNA-binding MarR family transcriptional regulator